MILTRMASYGESALLAFSAAFLTMKDSHGFALCLAVVAGASAVQFIKNGVIATYEDRYFAGKWSISDPKNFVVNYLGASTAAALAPCLVLKMVG